MAREFDYRAKQAGQLASKMRFLAAPWVGLLQDDVWLRNAQRANTAARTLADKLLGVPGLELAFPSQANALFLRMPEKLVADLHTRGWHFYKFLEPDIFRLMCSWATSDEMIEEFAADVKALV
jgi:threonine aldolase